MLKENTLITNFQPHFHLRGKAMQVEAILPDGSTQIISYVGKFNFNWMTNYIYDDDAAPVFPKGTIIHVSAWYDNTKANKNNPDPDQWVGYGDRTVDEMAHAWMNVVYLNDDEYKALVAERKAKAAKTTERAPAVNRVRDDVCRRRCSPAAFLLSGQQQFQRAAQGSSARASPARSKAGSTTPDGSRTFLVGYLNRNFGQALDVPIGPNNRIEPGGPDLGQPTHFLPGRQLGHVHRSGAEGLQGRPDTFTWTIVANGQTHDDSAAREARLRRQPVQRHRGQEHAAGDSRSSRAAPTIQGPIATVATALPRTATVGDAARRCRCGRPTTRSTRAGTTRRSATRRRPCGSPGRSTAAPARSPSTSRSRSSRSCPSGELPFSGKATTSAKFSEPGDYVLHVTANDYSGDGGGGEVCCWTTAMVKVAVK